MPIDHVTKAAFASGVSGKISYLELNRYPDLDPVVTKISLSLQFYPALRPSQLIHVSQSSISRSMFLQPSNPWHYQVQALFFADFFGSPINGFGGLLS